MIVGKSEIRLCVGEVVREMSTILMRDMRLSAGIALE